MRWDEMMGTLSEQQMMILERRRDSEQAVSIDELPFVEGDLTLLVR
jgi:hypothetical protein